MVLEGGVIAAAPDLGGPQARMLATPSPDSHRNRYRTKFVAAHSVGMWVVRVDSTLVLLDDLHLLLDRVSKDRLWEVFQALGVSVHVDFEPLQG